jgi:hypothetical protein
MKRRWRLVVLLLAVAAVGIWMAFRDKPPGQGSSPASFTDLDTALAPVKAQGWKLLIPPKHPGPYRLRPEGPVSGVGSGVSAHIKDASGAVVEEIKLEPIAGADLTIVYLETPDQRLTMAALKRTK